MHKNQQQQKDTTEAKTPNKQNAIEMSETKQNHRYKQNPIVLS